MGDWLRAEMGSGSSTSFAMTDTQCETLGVSGEVMARVMGRDVVFMLKNNR